MHFKKNLKGYLCSSYNKYGSKKCTDHLVRETDLISVILQDIQMLVSNLSNDVVIKKLENQLRKLKQQNEKVLRALDTQMEKLKNRKKQAHDKHFDRDMPKREYDEYVTSLNQEIDELMQKNSNSMNRFKFMMMR
ncbi:Resolvase domain protein [Paenibacillus algicola]|uniref:Resolvase domain protein n=1 Tax=Paenibacillus algicola TaxID=2565926 RepID=A0A4P8XNB1_9BACL|nr:hypothetical protein [Paenibacillus algicola]QCT01799.1 Resolvase domain protein [Paenibacillus algicola]